MAYLFRLLSGHSEKFIALANFSNLYTRLFVIILINMRIEHSKKKNEKTKTPNESKRRWSTSSGGYDATGGVVVPHRVVYPARASGIIDVSRQPPYTRHAPPSSYRPPSTHTLTLSPSRRTHSLSLAIILLSAHASDSLRRSTQSIVFFISKKKLRNTSTKKPTNRTRVMSETVKRLSRYVSSYRRRFSFCAYNLSAHRRRTIFICRFVDSEIRVFDIIALRSSVP